LIKQNDPALIIRILALLLESERSSIVNEIAPLHPICTSGLVLIRSIYMEFFKAGKVPVILPNLTIFIVPTEPTEKGR
jgi:hypothetical protein